MGTNVDKKSLSVKISSWNINGYNSKSIGNKLLDPDFLNEIQDDGIVGVVETHMHDKILEKLSIPGFKLLHAKNRSISKNSKKGYGGLAVFIRVLIQARSYSKK